MPGTIYSNPYFNAEEACKKLMKAIKGLGTDDKTVMKILTSHNNAQRQLIKDQYIISYGKELYRELSAEASFKFFNIHDVVRGLLMTPAEWDCHNTHKALQRTNTAIYAGVSSMDSAHAATPASDESALIEIFFGRSYHEIDEIRMCYKNRYGYELDKLLQSEVSSITARLMTGVLTSQRHATGGVDEERAKRDAKVIFESGRVLGRMDEENLVSTINHRAHAQLMETFRQFEILSGKSIENFIHWQFTGDIKRGLLDIVKRLIDPPGYFAEKLHTAIKGLGTDEKTLTRILISRSEVDLEDIKAKYLHDYGKSLRDAVKDDTSGAYQYILLKMIGH